MQHVIRTEDVLAEAPSFRDLLLPSTIVTALSNAGYNRPSPVQHAAVPLARLGLDVIIQAKAGTGKTLVFAVTLAERVDRTSTFPQALILAPTREVALQAADVISEAAAGISDPPLAIATLIGGLPTAEDERILRRKCHLIVGTPGRVAALIKRGSLVTEKMKIIVLDEADKLLSSDFSQDLNAILNSLPDRKQVLALSATYTPEIEKKLKELMTNPHEVMLCAESTSLLGISHVYKNIKNLPDRHPNTIYTKKRDILLDFLSSVSFHQAVIFCNTKSGAEYLSEDLIAAGHAAACLSSDKNQLQRIDVLNALRSFTLRVVVASDVAARGVDLDKVNLVINFEFPAEPATLMHRIGRAGRFGTHGTAVSFVCGDAEVEELQNLLERAAGGKAMPLPENLPIGWSATQPLVVVEQVFSQQFNNNGRKEEDRVIIRTQWQQQQGTTTTIKNEKAHRASTTTSATSSDIMTASLWPEHIGTPLPKPTVWPLQLSELSPAMMIPNSNNTTRAVVVNEEEEVATSSHYNMLIKSAELDVLTTSKASEESLQLLETAFDFLGGKVQNITGEEQMDSKLATTEVAITGIRQRRPLGSAQISSYTRHLANNEIDQDFFYSGGWQRTLADEAAFLEAVANGEAEFESYWEREEEFIIEEEPQSSNTNEEAWRQYWLQYYETYGCWPGSHFTTNSTNSTPLPPPATPPPAPAPSHYTVTTPGSAPSPTAEVGGWSPESGQPPNVDAIVASVAVDRSGYVKVPAQILQRYLQLEWQQWQQKYFG